MANKLHRHRQARAKETREVGVDKDAEGEEGQVKEVRVKGSNQHQMVVQDQDRHRASHRDNCNKQGIFHIPATTVVALGTGPGIAQVRRVFQDVDEEEEVAIAGDVLEAEAGDVKQVTRAWL